MAASVHTATLAAAAILLAGGPTVAPMGRASAEPSGYAAPAHRDVTAESSASVQAVRLHDMESVLGREVRTRIEEDVGRIIDLLADRDGRVQAAVIEFGGFMGIGTRKIAVEWSALRFEPYGRKTTVIVDLTRDQLRVAPEYKPNEPAIVRRAFD
jgi:hypothetical protein